MISNYLSKLKSKILKKLLITYKENIVLNNVGNH